MTKHEKIASINIKNCFDYEIGSIYNAFLDGETDFPTIEEAKEMIYTLAINDKYAGGSCYIDGAPREMRFASKEFCINYINHLFEKDSDVAEIPWKED